MSALAQHAAVFTVAFCLPLFMLLYDGGRSVCVFCCAACPSVTACAGDLVERFLELQTREKQEVRVAVSVRVMCRVHSALKTATTAFILRDRDPCRACLNLALQVCLRMGCTVESIVAIVENLSRLH
jgi:hypothetical protein